MGARRLRDWLSQPLAAVAAIQRRQAAVQMLVANGSGLENLRTQLSLVRDLERTLGRLSSGSGNARDLIALRTALEQIPTLKNVLESLRRASLRTDSLMPEEPTAGEDSSAPGLLDELNGQLSESPELIEFIARAIVEEPPLAVKEGGIIRDGFDPALDELRNATRGGKDWVARLQQDEVDRTGIQSLKVRFNSVFGYYIEVTKANLDKVPPHYIRKQTIANGERFITPELKEMEGKILGAEERSVKLEYELFQRVREAVLGRLTILQQTATALAQLDVLGSFAETARLYNYCRPHISNEGVLQIRDGRHPVLEQNLADERFVPNDAALAGTVDIAPPSPSRSGGEVAQIESPHPVTPERDNPLSSDERGSGTSSPAIPQIALITGPNMAGKSTYIRQVALLALLAHTGSFIPAAEARIDLVDRIFTRVGASDDLARGQSTFMVEMCETANILNNATPHSLVVLDEIGRGTSTFDGLSLAWSIVEYLHNQVGAKTLFATHYHELTELAGRLPRLKNFNVAVREWHDQIVFLRRIVAGGTDKSYGIHVARLAGVPKTILERAREILHNLEESELTPEGNVRQNTRRQQDRDKLKRLAPAPQMDLFGSQPG
jgi:DNA mismatch repair protein MutS